MYHYLYVVNVWLLSTAQGSVKLRFGLNIRSIAMNMFDLANNRAAKKDGWYVAVF